MYTLLYSKWVTRDFRGGPVVKILPSNAGGAGLIRELNSHECLAVKNPKHKTETIL